MSLTNNVNEELENYFKMVERSFITLKEKANNVTSIENTTKEIVEKFDTEVLPILNRINIYMATKTELTLISEMCKKLHNFLNGKNEDIYFLPISIRDAAACQELDPADWNTINDLINDIIVANATPEKLDIICREKVNIDIKDNEKQPEKEEVTEEVTATTNNVYEEEIEQLSNYIDDLGEELYKTRLWRNISIIGTVAGMVGTVVGIIRNKRK